MTGLADDIAAQRASRQAMARLVAVAGHDLKQPLHVAMTSIAHVMAEGVHAGAASRLRIAFDALKRLGNELDDVARLSQRDDALKPRLQSVNLAGVLKRVEMEWRFYAEACRTGLEVVYCDIRAETDPEMLNTILRNLVGNALKYTGPGGHVRVSCRGVGDHVRIDVEDDGRGVSEAHLRRIFEAFERGDQAEQIEGLGLGLTIVQQTADLLRHTVLVRSVPNVGSTFSVKLPLAAGSGGTTN